MSWLWKSKKEVALPLDPEKIRRDQTIRGLTQQVQSLQAQLSQIYAEKKESKEKQIKEDKEKLIKEKLTEQETEITKSSFEDATSFNQFFYQLFNNKRFRDELKICSYDFGKEFGNFGEIGVLKDGSMFMSDSNGNILSRGMSPSQLIWKAGSLHNYVKMGKIPLPRDREYKMVIDSDEVEVSPIQWDEEKEEYQLTTKAKQRAIDLLIEKDRELREVKSYAEKVEEINLGLNRELEQFKSNTKLLKNHNENLQADSTATMDKILQFNTMMNQNQAKITHLTEQTALYESILRRYEDTNKNILQQLEEAGDKTLFRRATEMFKDLSNFNIGQMERLATSNKEMAETKTVIQDPTQGGTLPK